MKEIEVDVRILVKIDGEYVVWGDIGDRELQRQLRVQIDHYGGELGVTLAEMLRGADLVAN